YLYSFNANNSSTYTSMVLDVASIHGGGGDVDAFAATGVTIAPGRQRARAVGAGSHVYLIGGQAASPLADVLVAGVLPDGTIGLPTDAGVSLTSARAGHTTAVIGD